MLELSADSRPAPETLRPADETVRIETAKLEDRIYVIGRYENPEQPSPGEIALLETGPESGNGLAIVSASAGNGDGEIPVEVETVVRSSGRPPRAYSLERNNPNPFNPSTTIAYHVPETQVEAPAVVKLAVFDLRGRTVKVLADRPHEPGSYTVTWDGRDSSGRPLASGVYFYRLTAPGYVATRKMVLLK